MRGTGKILAIEMKMTAIVPESIAENRQINGSQTVQKIELLESTSIEPPLIGVLTGDCNGYSPAFKPVYCHQ